jgi:hypothetical protein
MPAYAKCDQWARFVDGAVERERFSKKFLGDTSRISGNLHSATTSSFEGLAAIFAIAARGRGANWAVVSGRNR